MIRRFVILAAAVAIAGAGRAHAQSPSDGRLAVALRVDPCVSADPVEVERLFRLELATSVPDAVAAEPGDDVTVVELGCDGPFVELRVQDPVTGKSLTRRIDLASTTKGRERLLALAAMELLVASWIELEATPEPVVQPVTARAAPSARLRARTAARRQLPAPVGPPAAWLTTTSVVGAAVVGGPGFQRGGGVRVVRDRRAGLGWSADVVAHTRTETVTLGTATVTTISASLGGHAHRSVGRWRVRAGLGARLGASTIAGDAGDRPDVEESQITGLTGGPLVRFGVELRVAGHAAVALDLESGWHLFELGGLVDGEREAAVDGGWASAQLALGWQW